MALNKDQLQLIDWYNQGYGSVALRHGLSVEIMQEWLTDQGYYDGSKQGSELAERMLLELRAEIIGYQISCLGAIQSAVWLLLLTDRDKSQGNVAEQINTVCFDIIYHVIDLADDGTGLHRVSMTIVDETNLDQADVIDYIDQRVADLSEHESKLLQLLSSPQKQSRPYYFGLIDCFRALN